MKKVKAVEVVEVMRRDSKLRTDVLTLLLQDTGLVRQLAQEVMSVPAKAVGLCVPGTLVEFFNSKRFSNVKQG